MAPRFPSLALFFFIFNLPPFYVELILEDGYTVTTLIDGHKLNINPRSVLPRPASSDLIVLDSSRNRFYTLSFPALQVAELSGDGKEGYLDGVSGSARFNHPRSFAVDMKGNIYVADKTNHAIRKISGSGVTTIAGGFSTKPGKDDGPGKNATFSDDIEVVFVAQYCALLISDHGNQLVRQIALKTEDCTTGSLSAFGAVSPWVLLGLGISCLLGLVIGIVIRPYVIRNERTSPPRFSETWKHCLINPVRIAPILCFDVRSAVASSRLHALFSRLLCLSLSRLSLMLRINTVVSQNVNRNVISLIDSDVNSREVERYQSFSDQLNGLVNCDGCLQLSDTKDANSSKSDEVNQERNVALPGGNRTIDSMIQANLIEFAGKADGTTSMDGSSVWHGFS